MNVYVYNEGYIRTSSEDFNVDEDKLED